MVDAHRPEGCWPSDVRAPLSGKGCFGPPSEHLTHTMRNSGQPAHCLPCQIGDRRAPDGRRLPGTVTMRDGPEPGGPPERNNPVRAFPSRIDQPAFPEIHWARSVSNPKVALRQIRAQTVDLALPDRLPPVQDHSPV